MELTALDRLLPARVVTDHEPLSDLTCRGCSERWPCHTARRQSLGQLGTRERIRAYMTIWQLRLLSHPNYGHVATQINERLFGWIDAAVATQQRFEIERRRAVAKVTTSAQRATRALREVTAQTLEHVLPATQRGTVRYGAVRSLVANLRERVGS